MDPKEREILEAQRYIEENNIPFTLKTGIPLVDETMDTTFLPHLNMRVYEWVEKSKGRQSHIEFMTPFWYLFKCSEGFGIPINELIEQRMDKYVYEYADRMERGEKAPAPHLRYVYYPDHVYFEQEGIHRALAYETIRKNGPMPVIVVEEEVL